MRRRPGRQAVDALTTDNTILAGYASQAAYKGKLKVVGKTFSTENYGIGLKKGDTAPCQKITDALNKMINSGDWQKAVDEEPRPGRASSPARATRPRPHACCLTRHRTTTPGYAARSPGRAAYPACVAA